jgi:hypothetical protein
MIVVLAKLEVAYRVFAARDGRIAMTVHGSIELIVPTHAAAAPAINFALRSC